MICTVGQLKMTSVSTKLWWIPHTPLPPPPPVPPGVPTSHPDGVYDVLLTDALLRGVQCLLQPLVRVSARLSVADRDEPFLGQEEEDGTD